MCGGGITCQMNVCSVSRRNTRCSGCFCDKGVDLNCVRTSLSHHSRIRFLPHEALERHPTPLNYYALVKSFISIKSIHRELILCGAKMLYFIMYEERSKKNPFVRWVEDKSRRMCGNGKREQGKGKR